MSEMPYVGDDNFATEVLQADLPVLVDFTAVWCGPCKMLDPIVAQLKDEWEGKAKVVRLDVDHNPNVPMQYQVMGVPTLMLFHNGEPKHRMTGYKPKPKVKKEFEPYLT